MPRFGVTWSEGHNGDHASNYAARLYSKKNISTSHMIETEVEAYGNFPAMPSNETNKRSGNIPATFGVPISTQTKEPLNNRDKEKDKAEDYGAHARGTVSFATQTKDQTNALKNKPIATSPPQHNGSFPAMPSNEYGSPKNVYPNSSQNQVQEKNHQFSPRGLTKNSPLHNGTRDSSSPSKNDYNTRRDRGKHTDIDSDRDDKDGGVIRKDGVGANKDSKEKDYYQNEPNKRNGYVSPLRNTYLPKNGTGYEPSNNLYERKDKPGDYGSRDPAPFATQRKHVTNSEALKDNSAASRPPQYGNASSRSGQNPTTRTITCKEAAERYRGYRICEK